MSTLKITDLVAGIAGRTILHGINLEVRSGEVHAVMGPNGAGKSTLGGVLMGHPAFEVTSGSVTLDGVELLGLPTWQRAAAGLFLAPQDSTEIPGVLIADVIASALVAAGHLEEAAPDLVLARMATEGAGIGLRGGLAERALNTDASGGEKKRLEALQLALLQPKFALLDEIDSGLDVDALRDVARRVMVAVKDQDYAGGLGVIAVTHYRRLLEVLVPDRVHVLAHGEIVASGGGELAEELERTGYAAYAAEEEEAPSGSFLDLPF